MSTIIDIWNYLSDTKELIGKSNAWSDAIPASATTTAPPDKIPAGKRAFFNEQTGKWELRAPPLAELREPYTVYSWLIGTGEYIGSKTITGEMPANSTEIAPPAAPPAGSVLVFSEAAQAWEPVEDHRGETVYSTTTGEAQYISELGPYPAGTTTAAPAVPYPTWNGTAWVTDTAAQQAATVLENVSAYQGLMGSVLLAQCPLTSAIALGQAPSTSDSETLTALQQYAVTLSAFIQTADLTDPALAFPAAAPGLLDYPYSLNPGYHA